MFSFLRHRAFAEGSSSSSSSSPSGDELGEARGEPGDEPGEGSGSPGDDTSEGSSPGGSVSPPPADEEPAFPPFRIVIPLYVFSRDGNMPTTWMGRWTGLEQLMSCCPTAVGAAALPPPPWAGSPDRMVEPNYWVLYLRVGESHAHCLAMRPSVGVVYLNRGGPDQTECFPGALHLTATPEELDVRTGLPPGAFRCTWIDLNRDVSVFLLYRFLIGTGRASYVFDAARCSSRRWVLGVVEALMTAQFLERDEPRLAALTSDLTRLWPSGQTWEWFNRDAGEYSPLTWTPLDG